MSLCCTRKMLNVYFPTFLLSYYLRQAFPNTQRVLKNTRRVLRKSRHAFRTGWNGGESIGKEEIKVEGTTPG
jgi:hypothetical protein